MDDRKLLEAILEIFRASRETYGYPRVHAALKTRHIVCGKHRVARIMRENGLKARMARRFKYHRHRHAFFERASRTCYSDQPHASAPNQVWVGDVSYIHVRGKWSYIIVVDHYTPQGDWLELLRTSRRSAGARGLAGGGAPSPPTEHTIFHSDQGSEYATRNTVPRSMKPSYASA